MQSSRMGSATVEIQLNGEPRGVTEGSTVAGLLASLGLQAPSVLVEHNGAALFPREFDTTTLQPGDQVEIIRVVAGG